MKDLIGQRFGRLVAVRQTDIRKNGFIVWECRCDCGNTAYVSSGALGCGHTKSCGCLQKESLADIARNRRILDLTGQRFGRLVAVRATDERRNQKVVWECKCDCGNTVNVKSTLLTNGSTSSCGCLYKETMEESWRKRVSDLTGQRFGRLVAVRATDERRNHKVVWECKCDCGNTVNVIGTLLTNGKTASCGCLRKETMAKNRRITGGEKA